jgi:hypothetical protein
MSKQDAERGSTFLAHTHSDAGGRFSAIGAATVIGSKPDVASAYPAAAPALQVQLPNEEPLGYRIDELPEPEPASPSSVAAPATDGLPAPSSPASMSDAGGPSFSLSDPTSEDFPASGQRGQRVGSLPFRRRRM